LLHHSVRSLKLTLIGLSSVLNLVCCSSAPQATSVVAYHDPKYVIVTADDFGASENVDQGIEFAAAHGAITCVSVLANLAGCVAAVSRLEREFPDLGIGVHLNLTTGKPILDPSAVPTLVDQQGEFLSVARFYAGIKSISEDQVERELTAQIEALQNAGVRIDHLSDHNGLLSIYPVLYDIMVRLALRYHVALRSPITTGVEYPKTFPNAVTRQKGAAIARETAPGR
jgi:predicted glycoside hydrolase/deacetylase ChbG (UPF0249 family)